MLWIIEEMGEKWRKKVVLKFIERKRGREQVQNDVITITITDQRSLPRSVNFCALLNQRRYYEIIPSGRARARGGI
jgi:hypothetical protein